MRRDGGSEIGCPEPGKLRVNGLLRAVNLDAQDSQDHMQYRLGQHQPEDRPDHPFRDGDGYHLSTPRLEASAPASLPR